MPSQTCENCGGTINLDDDYCGNCGVPTPTLIKDELIIAPPSSKSPRSSSMQTSTSSAEILQTRSVTQQSKPTRNVQTAFRPKPAVPVKQKSYEKIWTMMTWTYNNRKLLIVTAYVIGIGIILYSLISYAIYLIALDAISIIV